MEKRMKLLLVLILLVSFSSLAAEKRKVIYKYKKYEKFDMDDIQITGDTSGPGDLSINPRLRKKFGNRLPEKPNFDKEMIRNIDLLQ